MIKITEEEIMKSWNMNDSSPHVSIIMTTYNHEKYISCAIEGCLNQITNFPFELIVHDDASTDNTPIIIRDYEKKFPNIIKPILEKENQYSKDKEAIFKIILSSCRGKYIAFCEGDDYWTEPTKLQQQFLIMERHPDISMCCHTVNETNEDGIPNGIVYPNEKINSSVVTIQDYLDYVGYPFQTTCFFVRTSDYLRFESEKLEFRDVINIGDRPLCMYMLTLGSIYWINQAMSRYRRFSVGSWSERTYHNENIQKKYYADQIKMMEKFDQYTCHKYNCHIDEYKWNYYFFCQDYNELNKPEYKTIRNKCSFKTRVLIKTGAHFSIVGRIAKKLIKNR